jgi:hypothetical protein
MMWFRERSAFSLSHRLKRQSVSLFPTDILLFQSKPAGYGRVAADGRVVGSRGQYFLPFSWAKKVSNCLRGRK